MGGWLAPHLVVLVQDGGLKLHLFVDSPDHSNLLILWQVQDFAHCSRHNCFSGKHHLSIKDIILKE